MQAPEGRGTRTLLWSIVTALLVSGCAGADRPDPIKTKYADADRRFGQSVDGGFADLREIRVPREARALTLRASFIADQGIAFTFRDPDGLLVRSVTFPQAAAARELQWMEASPPKPGVWRFGITCERACQYAFGFYFAPAVETRTDLLARYADAQKRFADASEGATQLTREFTVPPGTRAISVRWSADASDGFTFAARDPSGARQTAMRFSDRLGVEDLTYRVMEDPPAGTWTFTLECAHACGYAFGFYLDH